VMRASLVLFVVLWLGGGGDFLKLP